MLLQTCRENHAIDGGRIVALSRLVSQITRDTVGDLRLCHSTAHALHNALDYFGIDSLVVPVNVLIVRVHPSIPLGGYVALCGNPPTDMDLSQCVDIPTKPTQLGLLPSDFHSIVLAGGMLIDPTAGQFSRPQYGIYIPDVLFLEDAACSTLEQGVRITFSEDSRMEYTIFEGSAPYAMLDAGHGSLVRVIAGKTIRAAKKLGAELAAFSAIEESCRWKEGVL